MEARAGLPAADAMRFGLHLADVMVVGGDLRGDGVNLAARIQGAAEPGAIDVSGMLYDNVRRVSPCVFDPLGERSFKGVSDPIRVYRVRSAMDRHRFLTTPTRPAPHAELRVDSLVVAPLRTATSADEDQTFLADGLTDDLTLELSRIKPLYVSSRSAAANVDFSDPQAAGRTLGVRYVLSGSVRRLGARVRLNLRLAATETGGVIWSDRVTRDFDDLFDLMDEVVARVAATVSGRIEHAELAAAKLKRPESMSAYEHYLRGIEEHRLGGVTDDHMREAVGWFDRAIEADPGFGRPWAMRVCSWSALSDFDSNEGERQVARALVLDPTDPEAHRIMGAIRMKNGDFASARRHHARALELAPNEAYVLGRCAAFHTYAGEPERALEMLDRAEELDPFLPVWVTEERVCALHALDRFEEMFEAARSLPFQTRRSLLYRASARARLGETGRARALVTEAVRLAPALNEDYVASNESYADPAVRDALLADLAAAGLPPSRPPSAVA